ncbi:MAG: phosphonate ABC transporter, permease protein PhnE, partial [Clostridium celatum]|nr:phosphonate ABC transporter, permease protein PhnE [Clostridium celatum]
MEISIKKQLEKQPNTWISKSLTVLFILLLIVWASKGINFSGIKSNGVDIAKNVLSGIIHPDVKMLLTEVPALLLETICIALIGTLIGAVLAVPLAFLSSTNIMPKWISVIGLFIIAALRTFPAFVYGLMFIRVTGPGAFAGVLTVSVISIGMIAKLFIESIEDLDTKILESLDAAGCSTFEKIRYGI